MSAADDNDFLDGLCDPDFDMGPEVTDDDAPFVALFATFLDQDIQVRDTAGLEARAEEWRTLFPEGAS